MPSADDGGATAPAAAEPGPTRGSMTSICKHCLRPSTRGGQTGLCALCALSGKSPSDRALTQQLGTSNGGCARGRLGDPPSTVGDGERAETHENEREREVVQRLAQPDDRDERGLSVEARVADVMTGRD